MRLHVSFKQQLKRSASEIHSPIFVRFSRIYLQNGLHASDKRGCWSQLRQLWLSEIRLRDTSATRHFDTSAVIEEKPGHFDPGQFRWDTSPPVIRLKLRHQFCSAEVSCGRSIRLPEILHQFEHRLVHGMASFHSTVHLLTSQM